MNHNGYDSGDTDGIIGRITIQAAASFQYDHEFEVTGILNETDLEFLGIIESIDAEVSFLSAKLEYNHSVGNEWGYSFVVNHNEMKKGQSKNFLLSKGSSLILEAFATEFDKVPDHGSARYEYTFDDLKRNSSITDDLTVIVTENRGRFSGNTAAWVFRYQIAAHKKMTTK